MSSNPFGPGEERFLEMALEIVANTAEVERFNATYDSRDHYTLTFNIRGTRSINREMMMSEEEALEQLMEWCALRIQKIRKDRKT